MMSHGTSPKKLKQCTLDDLFNKGSTPGHKATMQDSFKRDDKDIKVTDSQPILDNKLSESDDLEEKRIQMDEDLTDSQSSLKTLHDTAFCIDNTNEIEDILEEQQMREHPSTSSPQPSSSDSKLINAVQSYFDVQEENDDESQHSNSYPIEKMHRAPTPWSEEKLFPNTNKEHYIMFTLPDGYDPGKDDMLPKPSSGNFIDCWDENHVKMPCSIQSECVVEKQLKERWEVIQNALISNIKSPQELEVAILRYNYRYRNVWRFDGLRKFFDNMMEVEYQSFFTSLLPKIALLALRLPYLCNQPIPLLKKGKNRSISFSQEQIACLLANAFFCTFPRRNTMKQNMEYSNYPSINFTSLYQNVNHCSQEKLKCLIHYFKRVTTKMPNGTITFQRQCLDKFPVWQTSMKTLSNFYCSSAGTIEDNGAGFLEVDFANKKIGGGVLTRGCVQEEIRFVICPELLISRLFTECLEKEECLIVKGFERFSAYSGYASTFLWKGDFQDKTVRNSWGRHVSQLSCIDAMVVSNYKNQFQQQNIIRELNKAYCGFHDHLQQDAGYLPAVCSGNWGCGAFGGDHQLKALIQMMACAEANRDLCYFTFKDKRLAKELCEMHKFLTSHFIIICQLMNLLEQFYEDGLAQCKAEHCKQNKAKQCRAHQMTLFDYIYQHCTKE
ncbi:poly(ADP-ribose) glycohydrolase isoform X1 [Octopus sinensis]|uniref:poly(ADP-ribose) glycohydrolase n=2 Tax=Octopus sinensis TaxID=2607531 RepID=A0A6P7SE26_9MOLL|nr:poly(ADP-ribose) glycohydrolase isoform X1 [Octopus sinensis]